MATSTEEFSTSLARDTKKVGVKDSYVGSTGDCSRLHVWAFESGIDEMANMTMEERWGR